MKILVTGGTGFIGSHLVERLRREGHEVLCVAKDVLNAQVLESIGCSVVLEDLNNGVAWESILNGVDCVYHVAGVTRCRSAHEYYEGNYRATKHFVNICSTLSPSLRRFVYVSSLTAVGPSPDGKPVSESTPYHPVSHYGKSKMLAELEVLKASDRLPVTIVRPSAVYGPRERDMYDYMRLIKKGIQPLIGLRTKFMSLIHSDDLVDGIVRAGEREIAVGNTYLLGSERVYSVREIGQAIASAVHAHPLCIGLPHWLVYSIGGIATLGGKIVHRQVFFNLEKVREGVQPAWTCTVEKAIAELGFQQRVDLVDGMRMTYSWYCSNGWME
jgi:nucleoside-diphosphate-sugar epimerase